MDRQDLTRSALTTPGGLIATLFGIGLAPKAPGTFGSAAALLPAWFLMQQPLWMQASAIVLAFGIGVFACGAFGRRIGAHDHGAAVWDEMVGMWVTLFAAPVTPWVLLIAFLLFRFFDVLKPPPIGWLDRRIGGGWGVMIDDVVAGIFAAVILQLILMAGFLR